MSQMLLKWCQHGSNRWNFAVDGHFWILMPLSAIIIVFGGLEGTFFDRKQRTNMSLKISSGKSPKSVKNMILCPNGSQFVSQGLPKGLPKSPKIDKIEQRIGKNKILCRKRLRDAAGYPKRPQKGTLLG